MNFIRRWLAARQAKRFRKWQKEAHVIFQKPITDPRDWQGQFKRGRHEHRR